jgi:hypothetical protein
MVVCEEVIYINCPLPSYQTSFYITATIATTTTTTSPITPILPL